LARLPQEVVSLVHHVQLNQEGWWDRAMERLVLVTIWLSEQPLGTDEVVAEIQRQHGVSLEPVQVSRQIERLRSLGAVVVLPSGHLKVAEERQADLDAERAAGHALQESTKARFLRELAVADIHFDALALWDRFFELWLKPTVCSLGARTYELITGSYQDWLAASDLAAFLKGLPHELHAPLRDAIAKFLDPKDPDVRSYLLRLMDAYFVVEASRLSDQTLTELGRMAETRPTFTLLLDTNVILSILGLHGEAKREAARLLVDLTQNLSGRVNVRLYALPETIDETRAAIQLELDNLRQLRLTRTLARAALLTGDLGYVAAAYAEAAEKTDKVFSLDDFLTPYVANLVTVLRGLGVELYNMATEGYKDRDDVLEDVNTQEQYEKRVYGKAAKRWGTIRHDTILWYVAKDKRPARVESPTDADYWVITEDLRLTAFDAHKRSGDGIPVCVQPLALVQILQFWTGRTDGLEKALLGGLQLSLSPPDFDPQSERTTLSILSTLSRYENVDDLPLSAVTHILVNGALRQKLNKTSQEDEQVQLIRDELLAESTETRKENRIKRLPRAIGSGPDKVYFWVRLARRLTL
jgi:predicted nucleic acid-binding protein